MGTHVLILTVVVIGLLFCSLRDSRNIHSLRSELHSFRKDLHNVRNDLFKSEALVFKNETELLQVIMDIKKRMPRKIEQVKLIMAKKFLLMVVMEMRRNRARFRANTQRKAPEYQRNS